MTLPISHSFHMDTVHWVLEAYRLLVLGTAQARQMHICLRRSMSRSPYAGATSPFGTSLCNVAVLRSELRGHIPYLLADFASISRRRVTHQ